MTPRLPPAYRNRLIERLARTNGLLPVMTAQLVPVSLTFLLALLSVVPVAIPDWAAVTPNLLLISVYHWTTYRPEYLPYPAIFLIGLLFDLLSAGPLGLTPFTLLLVRWALLNNRRIFVGRAFPFIWGGFTVTAAAVALVMWTGGSMLRGKLLEPRSFAFETVLTVAFFPVFTLVFAWFQRIGADER